MGFLKSLGNKLSSISTLLKISAIKLVSVVVLVVVESNLYPGGKNLDTSSERMLAGDFLRGLLPKLGLLSDSLKSFGNKVSKLSLGILSKRSFTVWPLAFEGLKAPRRGLSVVTVVVSTGLGLNRLSRSRMSDPTPRFLGRLGMNGGLDEVVVDSASVLVGMLSVTSVSCVVLLDPILIPSLCLKRSARDCGLKVVVVLVVRGGNVLILNKLKKQRKKFNNEGMSDLNM